MAAGLALADRSKQHYEAQTCPATHFSPSDASSWSSSQGALLQALDKTLRLPAVSPLHSGHVQVIPEKHHLIPEPFADLEPRADRGCASANVRQRTARSVVFRRSSQIHDQVLNLGHAPFELRNSGQRELQEPDHENQRFWR